MSRRMVISDTSKLAGELADVDRLLLGDPLEDPVPPIDRGERHGAAAGVRCAGVAASQHLTRAGSEISQQVD